MEYPHPSARYGPLASHVQAMIVWPCVGCSTVPRHYLARLKICCSRLPSCRSAWMTYYRYQRQTLPRPLSPGLKRPAGLSRRQHASDTLHHSRAKPLNMFDAPSVSITAAHGCMSPSSCYCTERLDLGSRATACVSPGCISLLYSCNPQILTELLLFLLFDPFAAMLLLV